MIPQNHAYNSEVLEARSLLMEKSCLYGTGSPVETIYHVLYSNHSIPVRNCKHYICVKVKQPTKMN